MDSLMHDHLNNHQPQLGDYTGINSMMADKSYRYAKDKDEGTRQITNPSDAGNERVKFPSRNILTKLQSYPVPPPPINRQFRGQHFPSPPGQTEVVVNKEGPVASVHVNQEICFDENCGRMVIPDLTQNFSKQYMDFNQQQLPSQNFIVKQQQFYEDHIYESPKFLRKMAAEKTTDPAVP